MKIAIIGSGYVGLVTGACFAEVGHEVTCVDNDDRKIKALRSGRIPIYEPGLEQLVQRNVAAHRLSFTGSIEEGVDSSQVVFIAVPTPPQADGSVDMTYIERVAREIASVLKEYRVIVDKSTVPVKTGEKVADTMRDLGFQYYRIGRPPTKANGNGLSNNNLVSIVRDDPSYTRKQYHQGILQRSR